MSGRISRRKLAEYTADKIQHGKKSVIKELAAYLIQTKRTRESDLVVRDVELALKKRGIVIADIASAYSLNDEIRKQLKDFISVNSSVEKPTVHLREEVNESLLGGVKVDLPGELFDGTIRHKLNALERIKQS